MARKDQGGNEAAAAAAAAVRGLSRLSEAASEVVQSRERVAF